VRCFIKRGASLASRFLQPALPLGPPISLKFGASDISFLSIQPHLLWTKGGPKVQSNARGSASQPIGASARGRVIRSPTTWYPEETLFPSHEIGLKQIPATGDIYQAPGDGYAEFHH
jgi:hypothetical protein